MRSYEAARRYFSFLGFLSWCVIILGGIVAFGAVVAIGQMSRSFGGSPMPGLAGILPGVAIMFSGFMGLVFVQIGRAGVDSAEYAQQSLKIAREHLEVSKQGLKQGARSSDGFAALADARKEITGSAPDASSTFASMPKDQPDTLSVRHEIGSTISYRGEVIQVVEGGYVLRGTTFPNYDRVAARIDATLPLDVSAPSSGTALDTKKAVPGLGGVART